MKKKYPLSILAALALLLASCQSAEDLGAAGDASEPVFHTADTRAIDADADITLRTATGDYPYTLSMQGALTPKPDATNKIYITLGTTTIDLTAWGTVQYNSITMPVMHQNTATPVVWSAGRPTVSLRLAAASALIRLNVTDSDGVNITENAIMPGASTPKWDTGNPKLVANGTVNFATTNLAQILPGTEVKSSDILFKIGTKELIAKKDYNFLAGVEYTFNVTITTKGEAVLKGFSITEMEKGEELGNSVKYDADGNMLIRNISDLRIFRNAVNNGNVTLSAIQTAHIVMEEQDKAGEGWVPIGNPNSYKGTYNGGGYTITGLTINRETDGEYQGLFGAIKSDSKLTDIRLEEVDVKGYTSVGGLVGLSFGTITKCYAKGVVTGDNHIGGLIGTNANSIYACYAAVNVTGSKRIGGLVGSNGGNIYACYATGNVKGTNAGGLVGLTDGNIYACYATGSVTGSTTGGLVGNNEYDNNIQYCHATPSLVGYGDYNTYINSTTSGEAGKTVRGWSDKVTIDGVTYTGSTIWKTGDTPELYWQ